VTDTRLTVLEIQLLATPQIKRGETQPLRGQKAWGLLAYLILSEVRNPSREHLAALLFGEAADPLRSLRWNLTELRHALGHEVIEAGQARLELPPDAVVDVDVLTRGTAHEALALNGLGRELLEGLDFSASPAFEAWLSHERHRLFGACCAALHEGTLDRLADGRPKDAIPLGRRLVELDPYDENFQESLIRAYAQSGESLKATEQLEACRRLLREELSRDPAESLRDAADEPPNATGAEPSVPLNIRHAARALLDAGNAAASAGAVDSALQSLRRAVTLAHDSSERELEARALFSLGSALVHGVRGRDEEGASLLGRAVTLAEELGLADLQAGAVRELSFVDALAGRYARCERRLAEAAAIAQSDGELSAVEAIRALAAADRGAHAAARAHAERGVELAEGVGDLRRTAFALTLGGRSQLLAGELEGARCTLERSLALVEETDWLAYSSWPQAWLAEVELAEGDVVAARQRMEGAFALACEFRDPCWEGMAGRGLGMIAEREGDFAGAMRRLEDARGRARRTTDCYAWVEGYALEGLAGVAVRAGSSRAAGLVEDLRALAARTGMRELAVRAFLYRAQLGDDAALETARVLAAEIENPALEARVLAAAE
jgi:DNA-binding SARP family transcriptional activator